MTEFEKWKEQLTLGKMKTLLNYSCMNCPLFVKCTSVNFRMSKSCSDLLQEWGNQRVGDTDGQV